MKFTGKTLKSLVALSCTTLTMVGLHAAEATYEEKDGVVVIEPENAELTEGWVVKTEREGHTGEGYVQYVGQWNAPADPASVMTYSVKINTPGRYVLKLYAGVPSERDGTDSANDAWLSIDNMIVHWDGWDNTLFTDDDQDYPWNGLIKAFAGHPSKFRYGGQPDIHFKVEGASKKQKRVGGQIEAQFDDPGVYNIQLAGRSTGYMIDRIILFNETISPDDALTASETLYTPDVSDDDAAWKVNNPDKFIKASVAPARRFWGKTFLINDWNGGDKDNQNVGDEVNRASKIANGVIFLNHLPRVTTNKVDVAGLVSDPRVLAEASQDGKIAIAMGAHSKHVLAWLTALPAEEYNYDNIRIVSHSNWNEHDGRIGFENAVRVNGIDPGYEANADTHGEGLLRGVYVSLAKISDLSQKLKIWEIPRTDKENAGWGGQVIKRNNGKTTAVKAYDISDFGQVHYLKTGILNATREQRNLYVSPEQTKPQYLDEIN